MFANLLVAMDLLCFLVNYAHKGEEEVEGKNVVEVLTENHNWVGATREAETLLRML